MKLILSLFILSLSISASAQDSYHLVSKQVTPEGAEYPCEKNANLTPTDYGYAFEYVGEFQTATNPGVYFSGINKGRVCKKSEANGYRCETATGYTDPLSLTKESCTTLLPAKCSKAQDQVMLQQNGNQLVLTYQNFQKGNVQQATCVYEQ